MGIPQEIIDAVRERTSISEIISEQVSLKRVGRNMVGLCPFHQEKSPSFNVREEEGTFYCFGCGKKGSVFDFVMETRGFNFFESLTFLANKIGIKIPDSAPWAERGSEKRKEGNKEKEWLRRLAFLAAELYSDLLWNSPDGERAREYLKKRGISESVARKFHLGYSPSSWSFLLKRFPDLHDRIRAWGVEDPAQMSEKLLAQLGLIKKGGESNEYYDLFRARLMFGITRSDGAVIGFGGRILEKRDDSPKYINSPESPVYQKRKTYFGLSQALPAIRQSSHVYLVEGYMDVLSMVQKGFLDTIATCGTAFTPEHVNILKRLVSRVTVLFDGDAAGRKAAASCFELFINSGIEVSAILLPGTEDPDSLAQRLTVEEMTKVFLEAKRDLLDVFIEQKFLDLGASDGLASGPVLRGRVAEQAAKLLKQIKNPVELEVLERRCAALIGVSPDALKALIQPRTKNADTRAQNIPTDRSTKRMTVAPAPNSDPLARSILIALLIEPSLAGDIQKLQTHAKHDQTLVVDLLPEWVGRCLAEILESDPAPVDQVGEDAEKNLEWWSRFLLRHELFEQSLVDEARDRARFVRMGRETIIRELMRQAPLVTARQSIQNEVSVIRKQEGESLNEEERTALLQRKIESKRRLKGLRSELDSL